LKEEEHDAIDGVIDRIWHNYGENDLGELDKDEIKEFLIDSLK
jgi:hypothetical protein